MKTEKAEGRLKKERIFALVYFPLVIAIYIALTAILKDYLRFLFIIPLGILFYLLRLVIILPFSKKERSIKNKMIRLAVFLTLCVALTIAAAEMRNSYHLPLYPYDFSEQGADEALSVSHEDDGRYVVTMKRDELKILQLTDIHIGGTLSTYRQDYQAFASMYRVIQKAKPDLIIITGDLVYPIPLQSLTFDNRTALVYICDFMGRIGIPWAFVYGNHETELFSKYSTEELNNCLEAYTFDHGGSLLFSYTQPDIYGRYNNLIEVRNSDGTLNQALFLIDSNDYASKMLNDYDGIHENQIQWYRQTVLDLERSERKSISSMLFFHIPIPEYETAYLALQAGADNAELLFGERREGCACSARNSGLFTVALELGSTRAIFCGHDHLNDIGIRFCGIDLVYGKSIDYLAYPGIDKMAEQRGGTMVTLLPNSEYYYTLIPDD